MQGNNQYKLSLPGDQEDKDLHQFTNHRLIPLDPGIIVQIQFFNFNFKV